MCACRFSNRDVLHVWERTPANTNCLVFFRFVGLPLHAAKYRLKTLSVISANFKTSLDG